MPQRPAQQAVTWEAAPGAIHALLERRREGRPVAVVGVCGPVGAGKSSLAARLGGLRLATDDYLPDYDVVPHHERDEPRHADLDLLAVHLASLRAGEAVTSPTWCFHTHRRTGSRLVEPAPLVVCEGIFALSAQARPHLDVAVYVDAPAEHRWARWEQLERSGQRGWGVERAARYFREVAEPTFDRHAEVYRSHADIIVANPRHPERTPSAGDLGQ